MLNYRSHGGTCYYHLNIKEIDYIVFITKMVHLMFHETVSRKLLVFTLYIYPYMSNGVSHFNLLDQLITTFVVLFLVLLFLFNFLANNSGETGYVASDLDLHFLPTSHKMKAKVS